MKTNLKKYSLVAVWTPKLTICQAQINFSSLYSFSVEMNYIV